jgi:hypothetical protein
MLGEEREPVDVLQFAVASGYLLLCIILLSLTSKYFKCLLYSLCVFLKLLQLAFRVHVLYGFPLIVGFDVHIR